MMSCRRIARHILQTFMTTAELQLRQPPIHMRKEHLRRLTCLSATQHAAVDCSDSADSERSLPLPGDVPSLTSAVDSGLSTSQKSAKRKAAEALIASKFSRVACINSILAAESPIPTPGHAASSGEKRYRSGRHPVSVQVCNSADCNSCGQDEGSGWCSFDVSIPPMNWRAALRPASKLGDIRVDSTGLHHLAGGLTVRIVSQPEQMPSAIKALRKSMGDSVCAIDLEWRPDRSRRSALSHVALMQLASATMCVLVRTCRLSELPPALMDFLRDPSITLVGYSWDSSDEAKLQATYGFGREHFARFHDLQQVSEQLGYHGYGLGALTQQVLGFEAPKSRKVTLSNWEAKKLSTQQIQYAALDAVITGHIFRGLRLWHASPSECTSCRQLLGTALPKPKWVCATCKRNFDSLSAAKSHKLQKKHAASWRQCPECGRVTAKHDDT